MKYYTTIEKKIIKQITDAHSSQDINNLRTSLLLVDYLDCSFIQEVIDEKAINIGFHINKKQELIDIWKLIVPFFILLENLKNNNLLLIVDCPTDSTATCIENIKYSAPACNLDRTVNLYKIDSSTPLISKYYYELTHRKLIVPCPDLLALKANNFKTQEQIMHEEELQAQQKCHDKEMLWTRLGLIIAIVIPLIVKFIELYHSKC